MTHFMVDDVGNMQAIQWAPPPREDSIVATESKRLSKNSMKSLIAIMKNHELGKYPAKKALPGSGTGQYRLEFCLDGQDHALTCKIPSGAGNAHQKRIGTIEARLRKLSGKAFRKS
jgi:hypothetical protein